MDKETEERALKALERQSKQYKRQNQFIKENYERQTVIVPNGTKERLKAAGETSFNGLVNRLIKDFLDEKERK